MPLITTTRLLLILLVVSFSHAAYLDNTAVNEPAFESSSCTSTRTMRSIILSCAATLFACTWTAIHPNMPGLAEARVVIWMRRLSMMILALLVPEYVIMWAIRQFFDACVVQKRFQKAILDGALEFRVKPCAEPRLVSSNAPYDADEIRVMMSEEANKRWPERLTVLRSTMSTKFRRTSPRVREKLAPSSQPLHGCYNWTLKHSFYAWMGGFVLFVNKDPAQPREVYHPLTPDELLEFLKADLVQVSMVAEEDLDDRSKGDWLAKMVAVLQLAWFIVHLAARAYERLPTTQLEIDTLAIAILCCLTYGFWWYKPKDVQRPVSVYWKEPKSFPRIRYSEPHHIEELAHQFGFKTGWLTRNFADIFWPFLNLMGIEGVSDADVKAHRVPYFCGYSKIADKENLKETVAVSIIGSLAGMVFGGVHGIAWNFSFPTYMQQVLWRVSSFIIAVTPCICLSGVIYASVTANNSQVNRATPHRDSTLLLFFGSISGSLYVCCRLIVIVLMFLTLRSLPAGTYVGICWTSLIPHL